MTIHRRAFLRKAGAGAAGAAALGACSTQPSNSGGTSLTSGAQSPTVEWRLASSYPPNLDIVHGASIQVANRVSALTDGAFTIQVYAAGELVPPLQVMDAVMQGTVHAGLSPGYFYIGKHAGLAFDTAIPFGLTTRQQVAWLLHGGGLDLINTLYADFGIVSFPTAATPGQMGGWFREPIHSLADLRGLRMRIPGIGGEVMARLGVTVQVLAPAEIYPALERGAIDATEWVGPYDDEKLGFHEIAKNYYYPGWWEPGVTVGLLVNREAFDELPHRYKEVLHSACRETLIDRLAAYDAAEPAALRRLLQQHGVALREYSVDIMDAAWRESNAYLEEQAASDEGFRAIYGSWKEFRELVFPHGARNELAYRNSAFPRIADWSG